LLSSTEPNKQALAAASASTTLVGDEACRQNLKAK